MRYAKLKMLVALHIRLVHGSDREGPSEKSEYLSKNVDSKNGLDKKNKAYFLNGIGLE